MLYEVITPQRLSRILSCTAGLKACAVRRRTPPSGPAAAPHGRTLQGQGACPLRADHGRITSYNVCYTKLLREEVRFLFCCPSYSLRASWPAAVGHHGLTHAYAPNLPGKQQLSVPFGSSAAPGLRGQIRLLVSTWNGG